jgi:hypothetical protein
MYVDKAADLAMAEAIVVNGKCQRPGVCNALEILLVHRDIAADFLPKAAAALCALGLWGGACIPAQAKGGPVAVDAEIVFAVDISYSMDRVEQELQRMVQALHTPAQDLDKLSAYLQRVQQELLDLPPIQAQQEPQESQVPRVQPVPEVGVEVQCRLLDQLGLRVS